MKKMNFNPFMPGGNKGHTYKNLHKLSAKYFKNSYFIGKNSIKHFAKSISETLEPSRISTMELFCGNG